MIVRAAIDSDLPFMALMLVEAAYPPWTDPKPTVADTLADPQAGLYLQAWGRPGDRGVIAVDDGARPLGAAWYRHFAADAPGYGFVSEDVPELAIAVVLEARGRGVGRAVLGGLIATAREGGELALSLDVSALNPIAVRLYRSLGFVRVGGTDENPVMVLRLDEPASGRDAERDEKSPQVRR